MTFIQDVIKENEQHEVNPINFEYFTLRTCKTFYMLKKLLSLVLNWLTFSASATDLGKLFHSSTMRIKKEYLNELHPTNLMV